MTTTTILPKRKSRPRSFTTQVIIWCIHNITSEGRPSGKLIISQFTSGEGRIGTDESAFVEILGHAGQRQAYLIFQEYKKIAGVTIEQALKSEMSGDLLNGLLAVGIETISFYTRSLTKLIFGITRFRTHQ